MAETDRSQPPDSVKGDVARDFYIAINNVRSAIKGTAAAVTLMREDPELGTLPREAGANVTIAYRHLEDASMRLGKALQALDGGVSVYDKATTVGA